MRGIRLPFPSNEYPGPFVLDASAIINLLGSGRAGAILTLLPAPVIVEPTALREVTRHPIPDVDHFQELNALRSEGMLVVERMNAAALEIFRCLTADDLIRGLDDGEAATIAHAVTHSEEAVPVIDERKAIRAFSRRWTKRASIGSLALLTHQRVISGLTQADLRDAIHSALFHARLRVPISLRDSVIELIGRDRASGCPSLGFARGSDAQPRSSL